MATLTAADVAKYFLAKTGDEESGDAISNLKLQKLLYYAQGVHLAMNDEPLFDERIEAWTNGPVIPEVYRLYKEHGSGSIPPEKIDISRYPEEVQEILDEVYEVFGQYSGWKLRNMTNDDPPYRDTVRATIIKHDTMKIHFKTMLEE